VRRRKKGHDYRGGVSGGKRDRAGESGLRKGRVQHKQCGWGKVEEMQ